MKVYTTNIDGHQVLNYTYWATTDCKFHFNLLSEVGEPWQSQAKEFLKLLCEGRNAKVVQVELDRAPWYVDSLITNKDTPTNKERTS